eukprot:784201-Alexandrium_andersonii.AAC.1
MSNSSSVHPAFVHSLPVHWCSAPALAGQAAAPVSDHAARPTRLRLMLDAPQLPQHPCACDACDAQ